MTGLPLPGATTSGLVVTTAGGLPVWIGSRHEGGPPRLPVWDEFTQARRFLTSLARADRDLGNGAGPTYRIARVTVTVEHLGEAIAPRLRDRP